MHIKEILDLFLSAGVVLLALVSWLTSRATNKSNIESTAFNLLSNAKTALDKELISATTTIDNLEPLIEDYLTALNYVCSLYNLKRNSGKRFRTLYSLDIKTIFSNDCFTQILSEDPNNYIYLRKAHVDIIEREK